MQQSNPFILRIAILLRSFCTTISLSAFFSRTGRSAVPKIFIVCLLFSSLSIYSQDTFQQDTLPSKLKSMSMEELMNLEVTSVTKQPEKLTDVASAIQVITDKEIRRSGATNIPEALRLVNNLQVSQIQSNAWVISARGFNNIFANKLLVMIDGRTVYSPLFAGVFWDVQNVLLEDIARIEVISGPGGTLWGANAVNGVINIITKSAAETQGVYYTRSMGNYLESVDALRYGGKIGDDFSYRVFGQHSVRGNTMKGGEDFDDNWQMTHGGLRIDWDLSSSDQLMFQANAYGGIEENLPEHSTTDGQNVMARWTHSFSETSQLMVQGYFDRTWRDDKPSTITDQVNTYDLEFQHSFQLGENHNLLWGGGYRLMQNLTRNSTDFVGFLPQQRDMDLYSIFIQDDITLIPDRVSLILGSKLQHNVFTGFEVQPSLRFTYSPSQKSTIWAAVSRAVRTPSRIDVDYFIPTVPVPPGSPNVAGGPDFRSESVVAYELGYRFQPASSLMLSVAAFINDYDDLFSVEALPGTQTYQIVNGSDGTSTGLEFAATWQVFDRWRVRGGYTWFYKELTTRTELYNVQNLGNDARNQFLFHSILNITDDVHFDVVLRGRTELVGTALPHYLTFDARVAWNVNQWFEVSVAGQNLPKPYIQEYGTPDGNGNWIERSIYAKIACRF